MMRFFACYAKIVGIDEAKIGPLKGKFPSVSAKQWSIGAQITGREHARKFHLQGRSRG
jgi:hypothetical protein